MVGQALRRHQALALLRGRARVVGEPQLATLQHGFGDDAEHRRLAVSRLSTQHSQPIEPARLVKKANYILSYKANLPLAIVEAKDNTQAVGAGMQQALAYAEILDLPLV